jgi:penicillin-binding protein 1A
MADSGLRKYRKYILGFWGVLLLGILSFTIYIWVLSKAQDIPDVVELQNPKSSLATEIYSADQQLIGNFFYENRSNVEFEDLPDHLVEALLATEDVRFYKHSGIDPRALGRVAFGIVRGSTSSGGGSTLTQQLAKNLYPRQHGLGSLGLVHRKFKEWILAVRLEKNFTKDEIMTLYLNTVSFMHGAYGLKSCAKTYFNKDVPELTIEESATIVGMLKNPSLYNPLRRLEQTQHRRNVVFSQMMTYDYMPQEEFDSLKLIELDMSSFKRLDHNTGSATYFREQLRAWLKNWAQENPKEDGELWDIYKDGLRVYTTIDSRIQGYAEEAVAEWMPQLQDDFFEHWGPNYRYAPWTYPYNDRKDPNFLQKKMKQSERYRLLKKREVSPDSIQIIFETPIEMKLFSWHGDKNREIDTVLSPLDSINYTTRILHTGMMALDPQTGFIRAWVGGVNHRHFKLDHVNKGTRRQVGSTFKPFIYTAAVRAGYYPCIQVPNVPVTLRKGDPRWGLLQDWTPKNSGSYGEGEMITLYEGLANSVNSISAYLVDKVGTQPILNMAPKMGIEATIPNQPSICLGTPEISLYEMVGAYTVFANYGGYTEPVFVTRIEDKNGVVLYEHFGAKQTEVMKPKDAYVMLEMLTNVVNKGSGVRLHRKPYGEIPWQAQIAGKTGTTQQHTDGWFMGLVPNLVTGVWVGADDPVVAFRSIALGQGANMALPIYGNFLKRIYEDEDLNIKVEDRFREPDDVDVELDCSKYEQIDSDSPEVDPYNEFYP